MAQQIVTSVVTLITFFVLLFGYTKLVGPLSFSVSQVTTTKTTTFDVVGEGKAQAKADTATVTAGVSAQGNSQTEVQSKMNSTIDAVSQAIKNLGVDPKNIQTANYNINPVYDYSGGTQKQNGFSGSTTLTIKLQDVNLVNQAIDAATAAGATNMNTSSFGSSDTTEALDQARTLAIADAKKKAQNVAQAAGFRLGNLVGYQESQNGNPRPVIFNSLQATGGGAPTKIEPGSNEVDMTVTLSYEIR